DRVITSADGSTWTTHALSKNYNLDDVTFGNGIFLAVGRTGMQNIVISSPDGVNWTEHNVTITSTSSFSGISYGNNIFVATAQDGTILTSSNGTTWTESRAEATIGYLGLTSVRFVNDSFFVLSNGKYYTSKDGASWTKHVISDNSSFFDIAFHNDLYVATVGFGQIYYSSDGINWTKHKTQIDE